VFVVHAGVSSPSSVTHISDATNATVAITVVRLEVLPLLQLLQGLPTSHRRLLCKAVARYKESAEAAVASYALIMLHNSRVHVDAGIWPV
jgi:chemotaxis protein CheY-P-specific phosphatase CheC